MAESLKQFLGKEAVPIFGWTQGVPVEEQAMQQLEKHRVVTLHSQACGGDARRASRERRDHRQRDPDKGAIVPAAVGVDLGCGMMAVRTSIRAEHLPDSLAEIRSAIEKAVPHGRTTVGKHYDPSKDRGLWYNTPEINQIRFKALEGGLKAILEKQNDKLLNRAAAGAEKQLGTLGTGNHFIEVCLDENNDVWVMLHSGSRGIGNRIATHFIEKAQELGEDVVCPPAGR